MIVNTRTLTYIYLYIYIIITCLSIFSILKVCI